MGPRQVHRRYPSGMQSRLRRSKPIQSGRSHFRKYYRYGTLACVYAWPAGPMPKEVRLSLETLSLGKHNPKLIEIRKAIHHGAPTADGLLAAEGPKLVDEALRSGLEIVAVFLRRGAKLPAVPASTALYETD